MNLYMQVDLRSRIEALRNREIIAFISRHEKFRSD